jgi:hypothetical protein
MPKAGRLHEQIRQGWKMAFAKVPDGTEIRPVQAGHRHEIHAFLAGAGKLAAGLHATAVAIQKQRHHHAGVVRRLPKLFAMGFRIANRSSASHIVSRTKCARWTGRYEVMHRARKKPALVYIPWTGKSCS